MRWDDLGLRQPLVTEVPEITVLLWATEVATTGTGEAAPDWLGTTSLVLGGVVGAGGVVAALIVVLVAVTVRTRGDVQQQGSGQRRALLQEG